MKIKTLKDIFEKIDLKTASGNNRMPSLVLIEYEKELKAEAVKIFNESLTIEEFGEKMVRFFEIQEEDLKWKTKIKKKEHLI